jgi:predicted secreted acid phosphatase
MANTTEGARCTALSNPAKSASMVLSEVDSTGTALKWASSFLGCMAPIVHRPCVVLDVDGTVLRNTEGGGAKCILAFRNFCKACADAGIDIFVVTARPEFPSNREWTLGQLKHCGIHPVSELFMRSPNRDFTRAKLSARQNIRRQQRHILLSIGDQFADLSAEEPPSRLRQDRTYVGTLGDEGTFAIKLPSEFS